MKTSITAILALAGAVTVAAVDFPSNMPECGVSNNPPSPVFPFPFPQRVRALAEYSLPC